MDYGDCLNVLHKHFISELIEKTSHLLATSTLQSSSDGYAHTFLDFDIWHSFDEHMLPIKKSHIPKQWTQFHHSLAGKLMIQQG